MPDKPMTPEPAAEDGASPTRPVVVQKYGGSSVADIDRLKLVARRVVDTVDAGYRVVVVVSAMGRTTDELMSLAQAAAGTPSRRELDMLVSAGERIASSLLAMAVEDLGKPAISFTGSQCGIITSHRHTNARILEVRPYRVIDEIDEGRVVIIAGYQGVSYKKEVTTLGRGGSDATAVAMAAALGAERCEICSDVDGVYTADPRVVERPRHLDQVSYDEMTELARYGARVLNEEAVGFARRAGIAIYARATSGSERLTRIGADTAEPVVGVTGQSDLIWIRGQGGAAQLAALGELLHRQHIPPLWIRLELGQPSVLVSRGVCHDFDALSGELGQLAGGVSLEHPLEAVTMVGEGIGDEPGLLSRLLKLVEVEGLPARGVDTGPRRFTVLLDAGHVERAQRAVHAEFVEGGEQDRQGQV